MKIYRQYTGYIWLSQHFFKILCPICEGPIVTPISEYYRQRQNEENKRQQQREAAPHTCQNIDAVLSLSNSHDSYEPNYDNSPETLPNTSANWISVYMITAQFGKRFFFAGNGTFQSNTCMFLYGNQFTSKPQCPVNAR